MLKLNNKENDIGNTIFLCLVLKQKFILSRTYSTFLIVQIITIKFIESNTIEHGKSRSLPAETDLLTLWCWMAYSWTVWNSTLVHVCGTQRPRNKDSLHVQKCTTLCFYFLLILMVEKIHEWITMKNLISSS